jgi:hypothetical protein
MNLKFLFIVDILPFLPYRVLVLGTIFYFLQKDIGLGKVVI